MNHPFCTRRSSLALILCLTLGAHSAWGGGPGPTSFEIDLNELKKTADSPKKPSPRKTRPTPAEGSQPATTTRGGSGSTATYTVQPGDNLFKILMRDFGMSNREAELIIPDVVRINGLARSTALSTGQKLVIPLERRATPRHRVHKTAKQDPAVDRHVLPVQAEQQAVAQKEETAPPPSQAPTEPEPATPPPAEAPEQAAPHPSPDMPARQPDSTPPAQLSDPTSPLVVQSVTGASPDDMTDSLLTAMMLAWEPDKVITGQGSASGEVGSFSVKVDRCLTYKGKRYVIAVNSLDPFTYTMLRLVETSDYKVIHLDGQANFIELATSLLSQLGIPFTSGRYRFTPPSPSSVPHRELDGIMVAFTDRPTRIFLTNTPLDPVTAETLASFSAEKL